jgi:holo-[acyl-carrier protein] synthase
MITGIGIDLLEVEKIEKDIQSRGYLRKVFTAAEIMECKSVVRSAERFAGRFAVKEAFMKAIGKGIRQEVWFSQIEVLNNEDGQPYIQVKGEAQAWLCAMEVKNIHVSITHTQQYAAAIVILEK